jgi:hypothetical protein
MGMGSLEQRLTGGVSTSPPLLHCGMKGVCYIRSTPMHKSNTKRS